MKRHQALNPATKRRNACSQQLRRRDRARTDSIPALEPIARGTKAMNDFMAKTPGYKPPGFVVVSEDTVKRTLDFQGPGGDIPHRKSKNHLPTALRLKMVRTGRQATFTYEEDFNDAAVVAYTAHMAGPMMPSGMKVSVKNGGKTIRMAGTTDYSTVAGMISSEFMLWNPAMEMTLGDIIIEVVMAKSREAQARAMLNTVEKGLGEIKMPPLHQPVSVGKRGRKS